MLQIIKNNLLKIIDDIDSGNTNIDEDRAFNIIQMLKVQEMSKKEAAEYLDMCRATFDNNVSTEQIPKGKEIYGFKEKRWYKSDLDLYKLKNSKES